MRRSDPQAVIRTTGSVAARLAINIIGIISTRQFRGILLATTSLLLSFALAFPAFASSTKYPLSYSGRLVDDQGAPLSGPVDFAVQFYRQAQDGAGLLGQPLSLTGVELNFGVFQVELSLSDAEIDSLFGDASLSVWIEVSKKSVDGQYHALPRQRFSYVPYAMHALSASTVPVDGTTVGFDATTGKLKLLTSTFLPSQAGNGGKVLQTDGSAVSWVVIPSAPVTSVAGKTGAVTLAAGDIASGSFDSSRIADNAVTSAKIANGTIATEDIANAAITDVKLAVITTAGKVANSATTATDANTASAIVARDGSGNFSAGTITANLMGNVTGDVTGNLNGNATTATTATTAGSFTGSLSGDVSGSQGSTSVTKLQGQPVAPTPPSSGQVLTWSGSAWSPQTPASGSTVTMVTKSADYTVSASDAGKYFLVSGSETTLTLPTAASIGSGATVTIKSTGVSTRVLPTGSDTIDGEAGVKVRLTSRSVVQLASDGSNWFITYEMGTVGRHLLCGANCYDTAAAAWARGYAYTAQNKFLDLNSGVWVQADGTNVLRVDGTDDWHYALNLNGKGSSTTTLLNKTTANLAGRACPSNVYVDDTNKLAEGLCLYYDAGNLVQRLDAPSNDGVSDQTTAGSIRIGNRASTAGNWYEGNIQTCANKGMRLPVLYETAANNPADTYKPTDISPKPALSSSATGVPSMGSWTWTASAYTNASYYYWMWSGTSTSSGNYGSNSAVRCVVQ